MSEILACPENTQYPERPELGHGWRTRLESSLLYWPAKYRHKLIRREFEKLSTTPLDQHELSDGVLETLRLRGLTSTALQSYFPLISSMPGHDSYSVEGALALIRQTAVQCQSPSAQANMLAMAATAIAMSGQQVHILTANDNSTKVLWETMDKVLLHFKLQAGLVMSNSTVMQRQIAYSAPVTFVSARDALRDYLDDRLRIRNQPGKISRKLRRLADRNPLLPARMRGLPFGIIVDANEVLIDQACAPMIIARKTDSDVEKNWAETALALAEELTPALHFIINADNSIHLTDAGLFQLKKLAGHLPGAWSNTFRRTTDVTVALLSLQMKLNQHYKLCNDKIEISTTSGAAEGMQQLLEAREGLQVSGRIVARGKLTFQRFFRRYQQLAALCTDTQSTRSELWHIYGLSAYPLDQTPTTSTPEKSPLSEVDKRHIQAILNVNDNMGHHYNKALQAYRRRQQQRSGVQMRRNLLRLDDQAGSITAFTGRAE